MSNQANDPETAIGAGTRDTEGLIELLTQIGALQNALGAVANGMSALGEAAVRQRQDNENMAAHVLAMEAVLTVMLRQFPVDRADIRAEVAARTKNFSDAGDGSDLVQRLADDILRRAVDA
ncbi:MAG: hypothetical protein O2944_11440 [Proteobacteria bacterium]|nr:hypothetical protein [Pseudomonadota bacterium]